ncbi:hypothetical protein [Streptomyces sp. NPDC008139]|uniref:hypothetical protein n=1 Tax=Streptomyces sp. NPDC008139 TaxID=3364814 RepID=UPI0036EF96AA
MNRTIPAPQYTSIAHDVPTVPATDLATSGTRQLVVQCPRCGELHRHLGLGLRRSPCGQHYVISTPHTAPTLTAA